MTEHYCLNCLLAGGDYGPIDDNDPHFRNYHQVHKSCAGWGTIPPQPKEPTIIEQATQVFKDSDLNVPRANEQAKRMLEKEKKKIEQVYERFQFNIVAEKINDEKYFLLIKETEDLYLYDEPVRFYKPHAEVEIKRRTDELVKDCNTHTRNEVVNSIKQRCRLVESKELFDSKIINVKSGILDPDSFEVKPHSPDYLTTLQMPIVIQRKIYSSSRNLKLWNHILTIIDPKDITKILELIWIAISGRNNEKKCFVFKGITNTQKTTLADIIAMIIGEENIAREHPESFLDKNIRFGSTDFIGKRMNISSEIGNLTKEQLERMKSYIGAETRNAERKGSNEREKFDPKRFVFLFTTNTLGSDYALISDPSFVTRFQFLIFRNQITEQNQDGTWLDTFFDNSLDRESAISALISIVLEYKKAQSQKKCPKTKWSTIEETRKILKETMDKDDLYFEDKRIIAKSGSKLTLDEVVNDFSKFVSRKVNNQEMGMIMQRQGFKSSRSNGVTYFKNTTFKVAEGQEVLN